MTFKGLAPWRWGGLKRWDDEDNGMSPFHRDLATIHRNMDRLFQEMWSGKPMRAFFEDTWDMDELVPSIDQSEDEKALHITVELPGMDEDDVNVTLTDNLLIIRGEKKEDKEEEGKDFVRRERCFGSFRRAVSIPENVDESEIKASFKKGVLKIVLPKTEEARKKVKQIPIKAA